MNDFNFFDTFFNNVLADASVPSVVCKVSAPKVDVLEDDAKYTLEMELPGRTENDVDISVDQDTLTISSKKIEETEDSDKAEKSDEKPAKFILRERRINEFSRRFTLPKDVDSENIEANFKNGLLTICMKKKLASVPKKIAIMAS